MSIEPIRVNEEVEALLLDAGLPTTDLASSPSLQLLGLRDGGRLVGVAGVEAYGEVGLLRSLAVNSGSRGGGLGSRLLAAAESWATQRGIHILYLLTTTAAPFFARHGYAELPRGAAPAAIAATTQFSSLCPASSTFMCRRLASGIAPAAGEAALRLASTVLYVGDVPAALRFYSQAFGFGIAFVDTDVQVPGRIEGTQYQFGELSMPGGTVQFATPVLGALLMPGFPASSPSSSVELAFYTDDVPAACDRAIAAGAALLRPPQNMSWGQTVAYLRTPDGTYLALCTPPAPRR